MPLCTGMAKDHSQMELFIWPLSINKILVSEGDSRRGKSPEQDLEVRKQKFCSRPSERGWLEQNVRTGEVYKARIWEIWNVKEFGFYPVINGKPLKDYEQRGDRIKVVFISNMHQMNETSESSRNNPGVKRKA